MPGLDLDDCTHFISCCIGTPPPKGMRAGGLRIPDVQGLGTPNLVPYGIISAPVLVKFLTDAGLATRVRPSSPGSLPSTFEAGDIVVYKSRENSGASDRKSTRLNSSHITISYAVFCLKK